MATPNGSHCIIVISRSPRAFAARRLGAETVPPTADEPGSTGGARGSTPNGARRALEPELPSDAEPRAGPELPGVDPDILRAPVAAVNLGVRAFRDSLVDQGATAVHVDWRPPAGGDEKLASILERLKS